MHIRVPRRFITSLAAGAMGLALVAGTAACSSGGSGTTGGGSKSTAEVCADTASKVQGLIGGLTSSMAGLAANPSPSADQQQQAVTAVKQVFTNIANLFRQEAGTASDSGLADALKKAADQVDTLTGQINSFSDLENLNTDSIDSSALDKYCPNASFGE